ncbi:MAG: isovaleryl-CoA dehydrogenase [Burkholderiales bacterium]|nr:isovaleryl-CoA dehydrogenase [Burkholderiales bacterium]
MTHDVFNQPPPLENYNLFSTDRALREAVDREGAGWACESLTRFGATCGEPHVIALGQQANKYAPLLHTHDRYGRRRDEVEFHPAWHELMTLSCAQGLHCAPWENPRGGAHAARAAAYLLYSQVENGTQCPLTMTYAAIPVLMKQAQALPMLADAWLPRLTSREYDQRFIPIDRKEGGLIGMGMTEKQGGSDVRANTTRAEPIGARGPGQPYRITGHKWFFSAPMCDAFLLLAKTDAGIGCFFLPRFTPEGELNAVRLQRLKDKLGNKSNASAEVEFDAAIAWLLGEEGRGVATIVEMATYTRLDCAIGTAGLMRQALAQAIHHATYRSAFGRPLIDQPLMQNVLADLAVETEAATALIMRLARTFDAHDDENAALLRRLLTPAVKYWLCKRGPFMAAEAMEVLGGNGYVEESILPRIYRELPLNSIWEGSGNIMCLDVLRAAARDADAYAAYFAELDAARGADARLDAHIAKLRHELAVPGEQEALARRLVQALAVALQGALLIQHAPPAVAEAFCASRIEGDWRGAFGTLPPHIDFNAIIERARPQ